MELTQQWDEDTDTEPQRRACSVCAQVQMNSISVLDYFIQYKKKKEIVTFGIL